MARPRPSNPSTATAARFGWAAASTSPAARRSSVDGSSTLGDAGAQAARCLTIIGEALTALGGSFADVVRTRMYITDAADSDLVGRAHGAVFGDIRPATTMLVIPALIRPEWKVEIEAEAIIEAHP